MKYPMRKMNFLIAEDDDDDLVILKVLIHEGLPEFQAQIEHVVSMDEVISLASKNSYDIILLDYKLGNDNGIDIIRVLRNNGYRLPAILLTGRGDEAIAVEAMKAGANDYISKADLTSQVLAKSILNSIKIFNQQERRERAENILRVQSKLLYGVSKAANQLLNVSDHSSSVNEALAILGESADTSRIFVYQDHYDYNSVEFVFTLDYHWSKDLEYEDIDPEQMRITCESIATKEWRAFLAEGNLFHGALENFPQPVLEIFENNGLRSVMLIPILIDFVFWGFIVFGDSKLKRIWTTDEESAFQMAVVSLGGEIKRHQDNQAFRSMVEGTSARIGDDFFISLVRSLSSALPAKYAFVCEVVDYSRTQCGIIASWDGENIISDSELNVFETPCEELASGVTSFYSDRVQELFPNDKILAEINAVSFAGVPFFNSAKKTMGFLAVADDKPIVDRERTISLLRVFASRAGAELKRTRSEDVIKNMAFHDSLTGLPNRAQLNNCSEKIISLAKKNNTVFSVMFMDFDDFKPVNDTYGHAMGDLVLKILSERISNIIRKKDILARIGGDEFILLLPDVSNPKNTAVIAKKVNDAGKRPINLGRNTVSISISIGVSSYPIDGNSIEELMKKADDALYIAKSKGKGSYHLCTPLDYVKSEK